MTVSVFIPQAPYTVRFLGALIGPMGIPGWLFVYFSVREYLKESKEERS